MLGAVAIAFSSILVRLSHASPSTAAIFRCAYALPVLGLIAWREDRRHGPRSWKQRRIAVASGVFFTIDLLLWHHSIGDIGAGLATVLANVQIVLVPLVAWAVLARRRLADRPRPDLAGAGLAADHRLASAPTRRTHIPVTDRTAGGLGDPGRADLQRVTQRGAAARRGGRAGRTAYRHEPMAGA